MISYYLDTHIARAVAVQLRSRGINVIRCEEVNMAEASDAEHLEYATEQRYVLVSQDADFLRIDAEWRRIERWHAGIMILPPHLQGDAQISYAVRELAQYAELIQAGAGTVGELENKVSRL